MAVRNLNERITMKDLARMAEVSVPTVSQVLNNKENFCSSKKREEILELARQHNYQPNIGYRIMTGMKTNIAAIIFSQERVSRDEHIMNLSISLTCGLEKQGYAVYSAIMTPDIDANMAKIRELESRGCHSFLLIGQPVGFREISGYILKSDHNYIGMGFSSLPNSVQLDEGAAIAGYIRYFQANNILNFKLVAPESFIKHRLRQSPGNEDLLRLRQKFSYIEKDEFPPHDPLGQRFQVGYQCAEAEYSVNPEIQGMIFISDYHALGAASFFSSRGLKPGKNIRICGMYNTTVRRFSAYPIISSDFDIPRLAELMLENLTEKEPPKIRVTPRIVMDKIVPGGSNEY